MSSEANLEDLDDGWTEEDDAAFDSAWDEDADAPAEPEVPGAPPRSKKIRPKRASREVREQRSKAYEQKKAEARAEKARQVAAKKKQKQPREKKPKSEGPSKKEVRKAQARERENEMQIARFDGAPDLAVDEGAAKRRGGSLQDALKSRKQTGGVPPYVGYVVLALLIGGVVAYLVFR